MSGSSRVTPPLGNPEGSPYRSAGRSADQERPVTHGIGPTGPARLMIAGLAGDSGKTLVSLALVRVFASRGLEVRAFKKGPDYIDAAWLTWASGHPARNLDTFLMGPGVVRESFQLHATFSGLNIVEGNRGLFDGVDAAGTHSTAELAKLLDAPVVLVLDATKATRTLAALVLGCQRLDPDVRIAGVILNRVAGERHERVIREAIESACGVPVLGAIPKLDAATLLPGRHLGLVTPEEHGHLEAVREALAERVVPAIDIDRIAAATAGPKPGSTGEGLKPLSAEFAKRRTAPGPRRPVIGYLRDAAFSFYYPENLEALEAEGATVVAVSALDVEPLPDDLDGLYIGGGFPETHATRLSANGPFLASLAAGARGGLPMYAECGGLMLLTEGIRWKGARHRMAGVLPFDVELEERPQGHGYVELVIDRPNDWFPLGEVLRGHEFHYSRIVPPEGTGEGGVIRLRPDPLGGQLQAVAEVRRGTGSLEHRDGLVLGNVWASYTHLHALGCRTWAPAMVRLARASRARGVAGPSD